MLGSDGVVIRDLVEVLFGGPDYSGLNVFVHQHLVSLIQSYSMHLGTPNVTHIPTLLKTAPDILRQAQSLSKMLGENLEVVHPVEGSNQGAHLL